MQCVNISYSGFIFDWVQWMQKFLNLWNVCRYISHVAVQQFHTDVNFNLFI